jgi:hypothetical protein
MTQVGTDPAVASSDPGRGLIQQPPLPKLVDKMIDGVDGPSLAEGHATASIKGSEDTIGPSG